MVYIVGEIEGNVANEAFVIVIWMCSVVGEFVGGIDGVGEEVDASARR